MNSLFTKYFIHYPFHIFNNELLWKYKSLFDGTQWCSFDMLSEYQWKRCELLLKYAYDNIPYYRHTLDNVGIHPNDIKNAEDYLKVPVLSKDIIMNNYNKLISDTCRKRGFARKTSGSLGTPLQVIKDGENLVVMDAVMFRNYDWFNVDIGDRQAKFWGSPLNGTAKAKTKIKDFLLNRIRFSPFDLSERSCGEYYQHLLKFKPTHVHGYGQTIFKFSEYITVNGYDLSHLKLKAVILTGEMVYDEQIRNIEKAFQCKIANEYGCTEAGTIAMTCPASKMHLMMENLYTEFVKDDKHVSDQEDGEIIITELYGKIMPLIRYKLDDIGIPGKEKCDCGRGLPLLKNLKGRSIEFILCPDGKKVDPVIFDYILRGLPKKFGSVTQFRIVQENNFRLNIDVCYKGDKIKLLSNTIKSRLSNMLGSGVFITINHVDYIQPEPSGKLRSFISRIK